jgi:hypothetical protein
MKIELSYVSYYMENYFLPEIVRIFALDNSQKRLLLRAIKWLKKLIEKKENQMNSSILRRVMLNK